LTDLAYRAAVDLADMLRRREIGCLELLDVLLQRVELYDAELNAIVVRDAPRARQRAEEADRALAEGEVWGPLHGLPITIKEAFDVEGLPTTWGVSAKVANYAERHAAAVQRLVDAGAVIFGKTNVPFRLTDWQTFNELYGTTNNPWDLARSPGGSSGGAVAALATGLSALELGSDIGGSLRNPAHFTGVCGHKPSYGVVPQTGHGLPEFLAPPDINVCGPLARTVADLELALDLIAGPDELDAKAWRLTLPPPTFERPDDLKVAVITTDPASPVDDSVQAKVLAAAQALEGLGAKVEQVAAPVDFEAAYVLFIKLLRGVTTSVLPDAEFAPFLRDAELIEPDDDSYFARLTRAAVQSHRAWFHADEERYRQRLAWRDFFETWDVLLCPAAPVTAFKHDRATPRHMRRIEINGEPGDYNRMMVWASTFGIAYLPSTVVPVGLTPAGLPSGVQIVGPYLGDLTTLAVGRLIEQALGGFTPPPAYD
jgi:amidase